MQADGTVVTGGTGLDFDDANGSFTGFGASGNAPAVADSPGDFTRLFYEGLLDDVANWDSALSPDEISKIRRWIGEGAEWQEHWSFIAPDKNIQPPSINDSWIRNGIDAFVLEKLEKEGW